MAWYIIYLIVAVGIGTIKTLIYTATVILPQMQNAFRSQIIASIIISFLVSTVFAPVTLYELIKETRKRGKTHG